MSIPLLLRTHLLLLKQRNDVVLPTNRCKVSNFESTTVAFSLTLSSRAGPLGMTLWALKHLSVAVEDIKSLVVLVIRLAVLRLKRPINFVSSKTMKRPFTYRSWHWSWIRFILYSGNKSFKEFTVRPRHSISWTGFKIDFTMFKIKSTCCRRKMTVSLDIKILSLVCLIKNISPKYIITQIFIHLITDIETFKGFVNIRGA